MYHLTKEYVWYETQLLEKKIQFPLRIINVWSKTQILKIVIHCVYILTDKMTTR